MANFLNHGDLNGECFIYGSEGEREADLDYRNVCVPGDLTVPAADFMDMTDADNVLFWNRFVVTNYEQQVGLQVDATIARKVAYLRYLAARNGYFNWTHTAAAHNVRYVEFTARNNTGNVIPDWANDANWREVIREKFTDIVCIMAYFFRVRGHHWTAEMDGRYCDVWRKCLYEEDSPGLGWNFICHNALHAIFPDDLDERWILAATDGRCAGALIKRVDSLPAGVAGVSALNAGVADLRLVVPTAFNHMPDAIEHLRDITRLTMGRGNRWNGSVNRRFYDAADVTVDEAKLGALAALIISSLEQFAPNSPLRGSMALKRIAQNAPLTGAVISRMIRTAVSSDAAAEIFLPAPPPAQGNN